MKQKIYLDEKELTEATNVIVQPEMRMERITHSFTFDFPKDNIFQKLAEQIIKSYCDKEEEIFIQSLRTFADPPIKGEITRGKIKWRHITIHQGYNYEGRITRQLFQKDKPISLIVSLAYPYYSIFK